MFERRSRRQRGTFVGALVAMVLFSGPWLQVGFDARHTRANVLEHELTAHNVSTLRRAWSVTVPGTASEPIVGRNRVFTTLTTSTFFGPASVGVRALNLADGTTAWDRPLASVPNSLFAFSAPVAFAGGKLASGYGVANASPFTTDCAVVRLDPATGDVVSSERTGWPGSAFVTAGSHVAQIAFPTGTDCVPTFQPTLVVRDRNAFATRWTGTPGNVANSAQLPIIAHDQVFQVSGPNLMAFPIDGCGAPTCPPTWTADLGAPSDVPVPVAGPRRQLFVTAGDLIAVDQQTGTTRWRAPLPGATNGIAIAGSTVYVTTRGSDPANNTLLAFAADGCGSATCNPRWTAALDTAGQTPPVVAGGLVYAGSTGAVRAFDAHGCGAPTCNELTHVAVDGIPQGLSVAQGHLLVTSTPDGSPAFTAIAAFAPASLNDVA